MSNPRVRLDGHSVPLLEIGSTLPLGALVGPGETVFRLFAPRAVQVTVLFFQHLDAPKPFELRLSLLADGVWEARHPAELHAWYYHYRVEGHRRDAGLEFDRDFAVLDPYALASVGPTGPGIIWDKRKIDPVGERFEPPGWHDLVILEAHVRDLIRHAPVEMDDEQRLGFSGLVRWLEADDCYLNSLGVNAVELQPIQEVGDHYNKADYHWGYMTNNWFAPESSYAQVPECGSQIEELQQLVAAFHRQGMAVILDVVYNHVGQPNHLLHIDKTYYFHLDQDGDLTNHSGCGNDLRCDTPMGRRLIIDSLLHLVETYDVDGFRFDLAELIGVEVLKDIERALKAVKPSIVLIAEPWSFRGHIALQLKHTGFASWNDGYRDFLRDYVLGHGNQEGLSYFMAGSLAHLAAWPAQTVNYVESHDDHCWIDRITENPEHDGRLPTLHDRRRTHLMLGILMSSIGIPMLGSGQDFLRSKGGIHNSYRDGDVNALDYQRLQVLSASHAYFRRWIAFRRSPAGRLLRLATRPSDSYLKFFGARHASALAVLYNADHSHGGGRLLFAVNPHHETLHIDLDGLPLSNWRQLADTERFEPDGLDSARLHCVNGRLKLPPLSCGLWQECA